MSQESPRHPEGGSRELLRLALPFILSNSLWTLQMTIDRIMLSQWSEQAVAAAMPAMLIFFTPLALFQFTANYATAFVAQYLGAGRPQRIGPVVWQALYFALAAGVLLLGMLPLAEPTFALIDHPGEIQELEATYFRCLCFAILPTLICAAASAFFAGRGASWTVMLINSVGLVVNAALDYLWISGKFGFPAWGIAGAGWATVAGNWASAILAVVLLLRRQHREEFATLAGWRFERALFARLMRFGLPNGIHVALEGLAFTVFVCLVGKLGDLQLAATSIAFTINMVAVLPTYGLSQAVEVLVGQRLGQDRPDLAERSTWAGFRLAWMFMGIVAVCYFVAPGLFLSRFASNQPNWTGVSALAEVLLRFVALYSLFDSMNMIFSFALRGAGDTRFVTVVSMALAWPLMVLPTWLAYRQNWGLYAAWGFVSAYVIALGLTFLARFIQGSWKSMRVIEPLPVLADADAPAREESVCA